MRHPSRLLAPNPGASRCRPVWGRPRPQSCISVMFAWAFIEPQFMFYAYDGLGWTSSQLGLTMSTYGLACMVGEFALAQISDRLGRKPVLVVGLGLFSAQFIGLVIFRDANWIMASFILAGLVNALFDPATVVGETITEHAEYEGVRVRFLDHLGSARIKMQVDSGLGNVITPRANWVECPSLLGYPHPVLRGYPPETVVAE